MEKVAAIAQTLSEAGIAHAFGGALALAYATEDPRGTRDIDVNVFVGPDRALEVFDALPQGVRWTQSDTDAVETDEQVRLWWDDTPVDLFFAAHDFHVRAGARTRKVDFAGGTITVLAPIDLAVFKVLFDRAKDWVDLGAMVDNGTLDVRATSTEVEALLGADPRVDRLRGLG